MRNAKRLTAILLCVLLICALLLSSVCIVRAANHVCRGKCCLVCSLIARAERMLHGLVTLLSAAAALGLLGLGWFYGRVYSAGKRYAFSTPVSWKIRLND